MTDTNQMTESEVLSAACEARGFDPARCSHLRHSPKGICTGCREQHQPLLGYPSDELASMEADFWNDWNSA